MRRRFIIDRNRIPFTVDNYLTIEALEDGLVVNFPNEIEYGIDGMGWFTLPPSTDSPQINTGHTISFRAKLIPFEFEGVGTFVISKKCNIIGNCMSLLFGDYSNENFNLIGYNYAFSYLFKDCNTVISVDENILPATSISSSCYYGMFEGCTSLVNAPELPVTTLANGCYYGMFNGCTNLNYIKMLATDISAPGCLSDWVSGVSPTGTFVKNKDATWDTTPGAFGYDGVPAGWTVVNDGQESGVGNDFGIEFPLYLEFDECKTNWGMTACTRYADDISKRLYEVLSDILSEYGTVAEVYETYVSEQVLNMLGIEIYIKNIKVSLVGRWLDNWLDLILTDGGIAELAKSGELRQDFVI